MWESTHPRAAPELLAGLTCPWWIAGGWALDLFMGTQSRPHRDLDVGILRRDAPRVIEALPDWEFFAARDGTLRRLEDRVPEPKVNSLWCRPQAASRWVLELLLDECDGDAWVFRRRRDIRRPLAAAIRFDRTRIPYLAPEIQLLYKAQRPRPEDDADFRQVAPRLDEGGRSFLHDALAGIDPHHPWLEVLAAPRGKECA
jgi:aminoglycoside-2''-adenylyltransferase